MVSKLIQFLGSIRLAVPLLSAIAFILIGATFYESYVGSTTVQREVYRSAWFGVLMFLLAVNLGISTLSRYPWRGPRKFGFALTHWGLVVIIAGSAAVIHLSTEGMLLVRTDAGPANQVRVEGDLFEVIAPDGTRQQTDIFVRSNGTVYPEQFAGLSLLGYSERAIKTVRFTEGGAVDNVAVQIQLHSDRMDQTLERWLAIAPSGYRQMDIGPAHLEIAQATDQHELNQWLNAPDSSRSTLGMLTLGDRTVDVEKVLGQPLKLTNGTTATIVQAWPDFRLDAENQPQTRSGQFLNPAVQINLSQDNAHARWFIFAKPGLDPVRTGDAIALDVHYDAPQPVSDYFRIVVAPEGQLFYAAQSSNGFQSGELTFHTPIVPGWADFQISLVQRLEHAQVERQVVPVTPVAQGTRAEAGSPALHVATVDGQEFWLPWGEPTTFNTESGTYFAAFSPKMLQLPFYVKLDDFIVERNEGSESVAMWTSRVTLFDPQTDRATRRVVWMNHPTWFRGWKLAQASWNPGDLKQSTLQVKREPWWVTALTWSGSLMVVLGIGAMFYGPGLMKKMRPTKGSAPEIEHPDEEGTAVIPILAVFHK